MVFFHVPDEAALFGAQLADEPIGVLFDPLLIAEDGHFLHVDRAVKANFAAVFCQFVQSHHFRLIEIEHIDAESEDLQGMILAPTRELAIQICEELRGLLRY